MARQMHRLNALKVGRLAKRGRHADGGGLYLSIGDGGRKRWVFLYRDRRTGKLREQGLGSVADVSLAKARDKATAARKILADRKDPIAEAKTSDPDRPNFETFAEQVVSSLEKAWRNPKHRAQWRMTLDVYCQPLGKLPVDKITTEDVLAVLQPIWMMKAETASRIRGRIEKILDAAKARGHRTGENPARWRGHLDHLLPKRQRLQRGHHPAMPFGEVPGFIGRLRAMESLAARALELTILTAARSGEVRGMRWSEVDRGAQLWTVPAERMKAARVHRVPLCDRVLAIVAEVEPLRRDDDFVFPGAKHGMSMSEMAMEEVMRRSKAKPFTVHGFRSSFKDWASESTNFLNELSEAALAHTVGDKVERAYRRGDALARRRALMEAWARFCEPVALSNVVKIRNVGAEGRARPT